MCLACILLMLGTTIYRGGGCCSMCQWKERVDSVAREIERYLESHPYAADSLEGITTWWVSKQRIRYELEVVRAALEQLTHSGIVSSGMTDENDPVYRLNDKSH